MEFKGTKGKWEADIETVYSLEDMSGNLVCVIPEEEYKDSRENWGANALLISKAPEMLEMLHLVADVLSDVGKEEFSKRVEKLIKEATTI